MAFTADAPAHPDHFPRSETPYASHSSEVHSTPTPIPIPSKDPATATFDSGRNNKLRSQTLSARAYSISSTPSSPVRRKPLPVTASPLATRYSSGEYLRTTLEPPERTFSRAYSGDSPTLYEFPQTSTEPFTPNRSSMNPPLRNSDHYTYAQAPISPTSPQRVSTPQNHSPDSPNHNSPSQSLLSDTPLSGISSIQHARLRSESALTSGSGSTSPWFGDSTSSNPSSATMSVFSAKPAPPHSLETPNTLSRSYSNDSNDTNATLHNRSPLKSPGNSKLGSFFGWGGATSPASSRSSISDKEFSPIPSPQTPNLHLPVTEATKTSLFRSKPTAIDVPRANADVDGYFSNAYLQVPLATPSTPAQVHEMEQELRDISSELASSIRREMDLEDLVERLQSEAQNPPGRRTSDYFSDSGTSSIRYGEHDPKQEELDRMVRKTEQEKAQIRLELTEKVQNERILRKQLEAQIRTLEDKSSHLDLASMNSVDSNGRLKDLESTCEDLRRRLTEERQVKDNFEDLLTALKGELKSSHNERDNLRDEIVPQLRLRVEGLEAQSAEHEQQSYEHSKTQQELQNLRDENTVLVNAQQHQVEVQQQLKKFNSIAEEVEQPANSVRSSGLTRSNSLAQGPRSRSRPPSLTRSSSVKVQESREALAERVKDVELQRDALHQALKSLLERQEHQNRENTKKIRQLEMERDRALSSAPRRLAYDKEVATLREEINTLRRRADEAIEQKWQCEKGLSGLKMDLDRAEQEIGSLRSLLQENDILIPSERRPNSGSRPGSSHGASESLEKAYSKLQIAYAESLERVKDLELTGPKDDETEMAMNQLEQNLADALMERDFAIREADSMRQQSESLLETEKSHLVDEQLLADELRSSAERVEDLAIQVRQQLMSNSGLRQRLAEAIGRGEKEQKNNAQRIMFMQGKLKALEDHLMAAQQTSEETISRHEEDIRDLKESHNEQLQRMKDGMRSPRLFSPKSPMSPMFVNSAKMPRIMSTTSGIAMTVAEDSKMEFLKQRVMDLETALAEADTEMEEVVSRMNIAQIEVMELQNEREEAVRETRRLQKAIEQERIKTFETRFASLSS